MSDLFDFWCTFLEHCTKHFLTTLMHTTVSRLACPSQTLVQLGQQEHRSTPVNVSQCSHTWHCNAFLQDCAVILCDACWLSHLMQLCFFAENPALSVSPTKPKHGCVMRQEWSLGILCSEVWPKTVAAGVASCHSPHWYVKNSCHCLLWPF